MESICPIPLIYRLKRYLNTVEHIDTEELNLSYVMYSLKIQKQKSKNPCHATLVYSFVIERKKYS